MMHLKRRSEKLINKKKQIRLLAIDKEWKAEWQGMPEFIQQDKMPEHQLLVNFENKKDIEAFAKLVNQKVTEWTKYIWFPKVEKGKPSDYIYTQSLNRRKKK